MGRGRGSPNRSSAPRGTGCSLVLAIIGGQPARFAPFSTSTTGRSSNSASRLPVGRALPGHIAETDEEAVRHLVAALPGHEPKREASAATAAERAVVPSPRSAAGRAPCRLARDRRAEDRVDHGALGASRFDLKYSMGTVPHEKLMTAIELYGTVVIPRVRELLDVGIRRLDGAAEGRQARPVELVDRDAVVPQVGRLGCRRLGSNRP